MEPDDICAECGHQRRDHALACAVRIGSTRGRDVYCPCAMFQSEELKPDASLGETITPDTHP